MRDDEISKEMKSIDIPDAGHSEERSWLVVKAAFEARGSNIGHATNSRRQKVGRRGAAALAIVAAAVLVISPAGASVRDWVGDTFNKPATHPRKGLSSIPSGGQLLVESSQGAWVVNDDGSQRLLGDYSDPTWSPHGRFIAGADDHQLVALEPGGDVRWALALPQQPEVPSWNSPDGFRIAYVSANDLRVVAGDGTEDRLIARSVSAVQPAWRPGPDHTLAFATNDDSVIAIHSDSGRRIFSSQIGDGIEGLDWTGNGNLLVWTRDRIWLLGPEGKAKWKYSPPPTVGVVGVASAEESGSEIAVVESGKTQSSAAIVGPGIKREVLFAVPGKLVDPTWSPSAEWLQVGWPDADQWVFLNRKEPDMIKAVAGVSAQFAPGSTSPASFPRVTGWCCSRDLK